MSSIRRFLVVVLLATITLISFLAALHGYRTSMAEAEQLFDAQLADIAAVLSLTATGPVTMPNPEDTTSIIFQVWRGGVLESYSGSESAEQTQPMAPLQAGFADANFAGYRWRTFSRYVADGDRWVIVAERLDTRFTLAESIILESVLPTILVLPLAGLLIWLIVGRGLAPLRDLASEMSAKRSDDLSPLADSDPPQEMAALIDSVNGLLRRLAASFERERRFAADTAHELRTPISVLKVQLHNLLTNCEDDAAPLEELQVSVERMGHSVEQVLMLYRTAPDQFAARFVELDVASLTRQVIAELYPKIEAQHQQIELVADEVTMQGDAVAVQTLLINLIENASKYSGDGGAIRVALEASPGAVKLSVEDSGPGIPTDQRAKVFERFYRGSADRNHMSVPGSGIGLAIVQHIAEIHGATIHMGEPQSLTGLAISVVFPRDLSVQPSAEVS
jgi:two-component system sensor histidine kinase QseC